MLRHVGLVRDNLSVLIHESKSGEGCNHGFFVVAKYGQDRTRLLYSGLGITHKTPSTGGFAKFGTIIISILIDKEKPSFYLWCRSSESNIFVGRFYLVLLIIALDVTSKEFIVTKHSYVAL